MQLSLVRGTTGSSLWSRSAQSAAPWLQYKGTNSRPPAGHPINWQSLHPGRCFLAFGSRAHSSLSGISYSVHQLVNAHRSNAMISNYCRATCLTMPWIASCPCPLQSIQTTALAAESHVVLSLGQPLGQAHLRNST